MLAFGVLKLAKAVFLGRGGDIFGSRLVSKLGQRVELLLLFPNSYTDTEAFIFIPIVG